MFSAYCLKELGRDSTKFITCRGRAALWTEPALSNYSQSTPTICGKVVDTISGPQENSVGEKHRTGNNKAVCMCAQLIALRRRRAVSVSEEFRGSALHCKYDAPHFI